jgi:predicted CXXCH cytochrome family protein
VTVNGRARRAALLSQGDVMTFGVSRLTVEQLRPDGVIVLRHNDPQALSTARVEAAADHSLKGAGLNARSWSWYLVLTVLCFGFLAPLATALVSAIRPVVRDTPLLASDVSWQPGPLHEAHRAIGHDCNVCHTTPFKAVANEACESCHHEVHQHVPIASARAKLFVGAQCTDCHREHDAQAALVDDQAAGCTSCHGHLKAVAPDSPLKDVGDFSHSHPEFPLTMALPAAGEAPARSLTIPGEQRASARQASNLIFSHKVHLDPRGIDSPTGRRQLECAGCHKTDAGGRFMLPIRMETQCAECHTLQFDEHDPASKVPHGDLKAVFTALREHFSRTFLDQHYGASSLASAARRRPGDEDTLMSRDDQRRALAWADTQTLRAANELLEKRVCVQCHTINKITGAAPGPDAWRVEPVRLTVRWYSHALFDHSKHQTSTCDSCHEHMAAADDSTAIHMPGIAACRGCHGDDESRKVASTCLTCHDYHRAENELFTASAQPVSGTAQ